MAKKIGSSGTQQTSNNIEIEAAGIKIPVALPEQDANNWTTIAELKYRPDRDKFILDAFRKDYPNLTVADADQVYRLASRSTAIRDWLVNTNVKYAQTATEPSYLHNIVKPEDYEKAAANIQDLNDIERERAEKLQKAASDYKEKVDNINKECDNKVTNKVGNDKLIKILTLKTNELPVSIALAIDNFTPPTVTSVGPVAIDSKSYGREMLVQYKIALIKKLNDDKNFDVDKFINEATQKG